MVNFAQALENELNANAASTSGRPAAGGGAAKKQPTTNNATAARVRQLEARVKELESLLASKHPPDALAALIQASRPSAEETTAVQQLRAQVSLTSVRSVEIAVANRL